MGSDGWRGLLILASAIAFLSAAGAVPGDAKEGSSTAASHSFISPTPKPFGLSGLNDDNAPLHSLGQEFDPEGRRNNSDEESLKTSTAELNFEGSYVTQTEPLPTICPKRLSEFFKDPNTRNSFLKGGGNPIQEVNPSRELWHEWAEQSRMVQSHPPPSSYATDDDSSDDSPDNSIILAVRSHVPLFPGLNIQAVSYMGCRLLLSASSSYPSYEFTLIREDYEATGNKALVWVFRQMLGKRNDIESSGHGKSFGLNRICFVEREDGRSMHIQYFGLARICCQLPRRLVKYLPLSPKKIQAKVSKAIVKQLEREALESMQRVQAALDTWSSSTSSTEEHDD